MADKGSHMVHSGIRRWGVLLTALLLTTVQVRAEILTFSSGDRQVQLLELYTSQGCSSCPPADDWLNALENHPDLWRRIVPVAFHVDYWDYLGWRDIYAASEYSGRQRRYRTEGGIRAVYTPGFIVNGQEWKGWFARLPLPQASSPAPALVANLDGMKLAVQFVRDGRERVLHAAILGFDIQTPVKAGENAGENLEHDFVVLAHDQHLSSNGQWNTDLPVARVRDAKRFALALWVSETGSQKPLQATGGWLPKEWLRRR